MKMLEIALIRCNAAQKAIERPWLVANTVDAAHDYALQNLKSLARILKVVIKDPSLI